MAKYNLSIESLIFCLNSFFFIYAINSIGQDYFKKSFLVQMWYDSVIQHMGNYQKNHVIKIIKKQANKKPL